MNKNFSRACTILGGLTAGSLLTGAALTGCGDDTAVPLPDATADVRTDVARADGSPARDAADSATPPTADGGTLLNFPAAQSAAICAHVGHCCFGADAAAFDQTACEQLQLTTGGFEENFLALIGPDGGNLAPMTRGKIKFDSVAAASCIAELGALSCPAFGDTEVRTLIQNCYSAVTGTVAIGQAGCIDSAECVRGAYCARGVDGGEGTCAALSGPGGACSGNNEKCAYRGYLGSERCDLFKYTDAGQTFKCLAQQPLGSTCNQAWECSSGLCNYVTAKCGTSQFLTDQGTCDFFKKDGG